MILSIFKEVAEFSFHLLWLAIVQELTVESIQSEIEMIQAKVDEHSDEPDSPETEKFPEYVNLHLSIIGN